MQRALVFYCILKEPWRNQTSYSADPTEHPIIDHCFLEEPSNLEHVEVLKHDCCMSIIRHVNETKSYKTDILGKIEYFVD